MVIGAIATRFGGFGCITYAREGGLSRGVGAFGQFDLDCQLLIAAAQDDTAQWCDVAEIAAPAEYDVFVAHDDAVGRVDVQPAMRRAEPCANPGVRLIGAQPLGLAARRECADVTGDVAPR